ncbi:diaminopimelate decarboxylase [Athalassotoga saccharophila]|uniref:diaminopimelate decarboxylase n=1 Tax=Athalassotoga saccharophila TaxID=1441386 RepID=UPI00137B4967|nr:diaminopimelate decarboxylase [Athalassotoga saccharophila]BBJ28917.1 diaminopimelate decarboxylase [Athalassotoga saccharophila]
MNRDIFFRAAREYGTPLYLYDLGEMQRRIKLAQDTLNSLDFKIFFAMKANSNPYLLRFIHSYGIGADVVSINEYKMARFARFRPEEIIVNGNGKSMEDLEFYIAQNPLCINVDSKEEIAKFGNKNARIALRINPDVDPKTHPHISTGLKENKFGMDFETAKEVIKTLPSNLRLAGLHCHIGSQITKIDPFIEAFSSIERFVKSQGIKLEFLNVGGGWGIDYKKDGTEMDLAGYKKKIVPLLSNFNVPIYFELGRFITASAGYLISKVTEVKRNPYKNFVILDASMADLIRPSLYDAYHEIEILNDGEEMISDIGGRICESGDIFARSRKIRTPRPGDLAVIHDVGSYGYSMASNYNLSLRPAEVAFDGEKLILIRKRERFEDILNLCLEDKNENF